MKISGLHIVDTYGTKDFKVPAFSVLRISGHNGSGKSSILRALAYLFGGGTDPSVIRKGAEQSVVRLELDTGAYYVKTTRPKRARKGAEITGYVATLEGYAPDGTPVPSPQTQLNQLADSLAIDPSILLRMDASTVPGRRALAAEFLKLIPISFAPDEVATACLHCSVDGAGQPDALAIDVPKAPLSLEDLKKVVSVVTESRRREGQTRDSAAGAVTRLQGALPDSTAAGEVWLESATKAALEDAEEYRRAVESAISDQKLELERQKNAAVAEATAAWNADVKAINDGIDAQIRALEEQRNARCNSARDVLDQKKGAAQQTERQALEQLATESKPEGRSSPSSACSTRWAPHLDGTRTTSRTSRSRCSSRCTGRNRSRFSGGHGREPI